MILTRTYRYLTKGRRFVRNARGMAATEFALILPVMLFLFVGVAEVGEAMSISRKVTITTRTVTDLVAQNSSISGSLLSTILSASAEVVAPYASSNLTVTVSEISTDANSTATVTWSGSWPNNSNALKTGSTFTLPSSLKAANISLVYGQVTYNFTPVLGYKIIGPIGLSDQIYMSPRASTSIAYTGS